MIHIDNHEHGQRIMEAAGSDFSPVTMEVISRSENGVLYGGAIYENYTGKGGSVLAHIAGFKPNWLNRDMLWIMFNYPFVQLDCRQAFGQVKASNHDVRKFNKSLGWEEIFTLEDVFPDDDMILIRMKREDCRFLNIKPKKVGPKRTVDNG
jgi:hypothetical protein